MVQIVTRVQSTSELIIRFQVTVEWRLNDSLVQTPSSALNESVGWISISISLRPSAPRLKDIASFPEYLEALVMLLTESVYRVVSYALFARHKLTFSFMLCAGIMRHSVAKSFEATIKEEEWNWFVRGSAVAAISDRLENEEDLDSGVQPSSIAGANQCYQEYTVSIVLCALVKRCFNYRVARKIWGSFFLRVGNLQYSM